MTDNYTYARPYAEAAFKTADADKTVADWKNDLETLSYVTDRQDIKALLSNPKVSQSKSIEFLMSFLKDKKNSKMINFLNNLFANKRIFYLKEIYELYDKISSASKNISVAEIETSYELTPKQKDSIKNFLNKKFQNKIIVQELINKNLLGGVKIKIDDEVIDFSIKNKLEQMKQELIK
ncbi:MAG: hypothetical protein CMD65_00815 [Gammaproteobacteria bacterium]|nr:hypothetical protein [Gammaproteobacteria bacterium]|tara:strand:+ start:726 stop:1262 length:537 start_codon:yes stop_codon:yes gene_type:complete